MKTMKKAAALLLVLSLVLALGACGQEKAQDQALEEITLVLDWTPNTNHTGIYVAQEKGYFAENGLNVTVVQPPEDGAALLVSSGRAQFGISFQDSMAPALTGDSPLDITAVAAILQHNTSGIVSRKGEGMDRPKGLEGHKYATWDMAVEKATLKQVVEKDGGDFSKVELIPSTVTDEVSALQSKSVDAIWIFYGWAGIACETAQLPIDYFAFKDMDPVFDFYTPVVIANNAFLKDQPETAKKVMDALSKGYTYAAENPEEAAQILIKASPELKDSEDLVVASQKSLAKEYVADAERWGQIDPERWGGFFTWLNENGLTESPLDPAAGFTNDYLPEK